MFTDAEIRCLFSPTEVGVCFSAKVGKFIVLGGGGGGWGRSEGGKAPIPSTITKEKVNAPPCPAYLMNVNFGQND